jgi:galactokinase/mevalonate kinase-like predicted kinase
MKRKRSSNMSNGDVNRWYQLGRDAAIGGKMVGAGGGGFPVLYDRSHAFGLQWPRKA